MVDLPAPVWPDERDRRAGRDVEVEVVQDVRQVAVAEADVVEADVPANRGQLARVGASTTSGSSSSTAMIRSSAAVAERNVL